MNLSKSQHENITQKQNQKKLWIKFVAELSDQLSLETPKEKQVGTNQQSQDL